MASSSSSDPGKLEVSEMARQVIEECQEQLNSFNRPQAPSSVSTEEPRPIFQAENTEFNRRHSIIAAEITNHASRLLHLVDARFHELYRDYYMTLQNKYMDLVEENNKLKARLETISRAMSE